MGPIENKPTFVQYIFKTSWQSRHKENILIWHFYSNGFTIIENTFYKWKPFFRSIKHPTKCTMATMIHATIQLTSCTFTPSESSILCDIVVNTANGEAGWMPYSTNQCMSINTPSLIYFLGSWSCVCISIINYAIHIFSASTTLLCMCPVGPWMGWNDQDYVTR